MGGFAEEVKASKSKQPAAPAVDPATPAAPAAVVAKPELVDPGPFLPVGAKPVDHQAKVAEELEKLKNPPPPDVRDEKPKIKIAGKEFSTVEEAIKYAEELEIASIEDKAYRQGVEAADKANKPQIDPQPQKTLDEEVEEILFEDPKVAIKRLREGITKEIFDAYDKMTTSQQKAVLQKAQADKTWNDFYEQNTDLAESKEYVEYLLKKNWDDLSKKDSVVALSELAELTRKGLKITKTAALPTRELSSKPAVGPGASTESTHSEEAATTSEELDFVSQVRKLRKRK
jgi:hypothetical protein